MVDTDIFGQPTTESLPAHQRHSETSRAAAVAIEPFAEKIRCEVFDLLQRRPSTDEEVQTILRMNPSTERPRRVELVKQGLVRDSGKKRNTRSGRLAVVWEPTGS